MVRIFKCLENLVFYPTTHRASRLRRITQEHRLAYKVSGGRILFAQARYHY
ncbi:MAG: type II toxin-antitoxin system YoeB family toxin [Verrucomicrobia bacterium]|nr:type II toxin-antitoxin system YoeB family toxin [Verrucomicrobiota bacterium]